MYYSLVGKGGQVVRLVLISHGSGVCPPKICRRDSGRKSEHILLKLGS